MCVLEEVLRVLNSLCGDGYDDECKEDKVLAVCPVCSHSAPPRPVQLGDREEHEKVVEEFELLGSTCISHDCSLDHEIDTVNEST